MTRRVLTILIVAVAIVASACGSNTQSPQPPQEVKVTTTSMSTTTTGLVTTSSTTAQSATTTSTTITPSTTTVATSSDCPDFDPTGQVLRKLASLKFFDPKVDTCDPAAIKDVLAAFQKSQRLENINGLYTPELAQAILDAQPIAASLGTEPNRIVVELDRQLMFLYRDGQLVRVQHVSTGSDSLMPTPQGRFYITQMYPGRPPGEDSEHPMYFSDIEGVSIHGYPTVPYHEAASHGCVRMPLQVINWYYDQVDQMTDSGLMLVYVM